MASLLNQLIYSGTQHPIQYANFWHEGENVYKIEIVSEDTISIRLVIKRLKKDFYVDTVKILPNLI